MKIDNLTLTPGDFVFWIINNFHFISEPSELWSWGTLKSTSDDTSVTNHDLSVIENGGEFWFQVEVHLWVDWFDVGGGFLWNISEFLGGSTFGKTDFVDGLDSEIMNFKNVLLDILVMLFSMFLKKLKLNHFPNQ